MKRKIAWALAGCLWAQLGLAQAENISLRLGYVAAPGGASFSLLAAERGEFGLSVARPEHAQEAQWRVLAKNDKGQVLYQTTLKNGLQRQAEVFDPRSGAIAEVHSVKRSTGVVELSLPYDSQMAKIEILPAAGSTAGLSGDALAGQSAAAPLAQFSRSTLEAQLAGTAAHRLAERSALAGVTATTIIETGPAAARMDVVFVGDGYTALEMDKWRADAQKVINGFMADPLLAANRGTINVRRVDVASTQSGVDEPDKGIYRTTAMDGAFNCANIARLLCVNETKVFNIVGSVLAPDARDIVVVISNSTRYGGSGGEVAAMSMNAQSIEVALHEIGHTAFGLADEYEYGTCDTSREPAEGDVSRVGTRSVKWASLIKSTTTVPTTPGQYPNGTVGTFQGARYCSSGMFRPTENSRMRTLNYPWHAVNEGLAARVFAQYGGSSGGGVTQSGVLNSGGSALAPSAAPNYVQAGAGTISLNLTGPAGSNFDLALYQYNGSAWVKVAGSTSSGPNEAISYNGSAGYYYAEVRAVSGSGNYSLTYRFPAK
jgi:hypothetical protein